MTTTVSVCMATYNGSEYVTHQLQSILDELEDQDEVVVVDDASTDDTVAVIEALGDSRIRVIRQESNRGYVRTFESALAAAAGDVLLLADQDDEWIPGRRPLTGRPWRLGPLHGGGSLRNELRLLAGDAPYYGCAMAVRRDLRDTVLPFPAFLTESHDLWIATVANTSRSMSHVTEPVLRRRLHGGNASAPKPRGVLKALGSRWMLLRAWNEAAKRTRRRGGSAVRTG